MGKHKTGLIMGCFDLLHHGHCKVLEMSSDLCEFLVVGLADNKTVRDVKGYDRPLVGYKYRKFMLDSLEFVDFVVPFSLDSQSNVVSAISPDICFSGIGGNPRLQHIILDLGLGIEFRKLDAEVIHTTDILNTLNPGKKEETTCPGDIWE